MNKFSVGKEDILTNTLTGEKYEVVERFQYIDPLYYPPVYAYNIKNIDTGELKTIKVEDYEDYGIANWDTFKTKDGKPWI